jgi:hypothetical protein
MGVLTCDRRDCENIMCRRYSHKYGYICEECFEELVITDEKISVFMGKVKDIDFNIEGRSELWEQEFVEEDVK